LFVNKIGFGANDGIAAVNDVLWGKIHNFPVILAVECGRLSAPIYFMQVRPRPVVLQSFSKVRILSIWHLINIT